MWVEPLENGKFKYCERYTDPLTGKAKRVSVTLLKDNKLTRKDAAAILADKIAAINNPALKRENITLKELTELYIEYQKKTVTAGTWRRNSCSMGTICRLLNPAAIVSNLTAGYVSGNLFTPEDKPCTKNERLARFKALVRWAYQNDYLEDIRGLDKLRPVNDKEGKEALAHKFLEKEELSLLINSMEVVRWKRLTLFLALTGARIGEALALTIDDVDLKNSVIHINKTADIAICGDIHSPKTQSSNRDISIQPELEELCKEIKKDLNAHRFKSGVRAKLFFCDASGDYLKYYSFNKYLKETSARVLGRVITPHALRHTHVSLLAEAGVPLDTITRRVGHEDSRVTKNIYLHITERMKEKDKELLNHVSLLA